MNYATRVDWWAPEPPRRGENHILRVVGSRHTRDLLSITLFYWLGLVLELAHLAYDHTAKLNVSAFWEQVHLEFDHILSSNSGVAIALLTTGFGLTAWCYQSANLRLGVVDLFASELTTLCRVAGLSHFVERLTQQFVTNTEQVPEYHIPREQEDYLIIFNTCIKDLEALDGRVVESVTAVYTFFKALKARVHSLADWHESTDQEENASEELCARNRLVLEAVYSAFLTFESAREALSNLMAPGPFKAARPEATLHALISEVAAYKFLYEHCKELRDDARELRIKCRYTVYERMIKVIEETDDSEMSDIHAWTEMKRQVVNMFKTIPPEGTGDGPPPRPRWRLISITWSR